MGFAWILLLVTVRYGPKIRSVPKSPSGKRTKIQKLRSTGLITERIDDHIIAGVFGSFALCSLRFLGYWCSVVMIPWYFSAGSRTPRVIFPNDCCGLSSKNAPWASFFGCKGAKQRWLWSAILNKRSNMIASYFNMTYFIIFIHDIGFKKQSMYVPPWSHAWCKTIKLWRSRAYHNPSVQPSTRSSHSKSGITWRTAPRCQFLQYILFVWDHAQQNPMVNSHPSVHCSHFAFSPSTVFFRRVNRWGILGHLRPFTMIPRSGDWFWMHLPARNKPW